VSVAMTDLESRTFVDATCGLTLPYRLFVPQPTRPPLGLLLFLHGAGERGSDNQAQLKNDALAWVQPALQDQHPTVVVFPQCPADAMWVDTPWDEGRYSIEQTPISKPMSAVLNLLASVQDEFAIDEHRLLVTGLSMGGYGAWDIVARNPTKFAGALVLCGGGDPSQAPALRDLPLWVFHGEDDAAVPVRGSRLMIQALRAVGAKPRYSELPDVGHNVWIHAYRDPEVLSWLLSQTRP